MSTVMLLNHSETDRKKGAVRGRESRNQSLNTKLTPTEFAEVEVAAAAHGCALGEWVRDVILRELREGSASDPSLAEILGVRLLLVTCCDRWPQARDSHRRRSTNCSTKSAMRSTNSLASWLVLQEGNRQWR